MILLSGRLIEYNSYTRSPQVRQHSHMRPHLPGPDGIKSRFGRTDNWRKGLVVNFSPQFLVGSIAARSKQTDDRWVPYAARTSPKASRMTQESSTVARRPGTQGML
jgi:hypothetical protein